MSRKFIETESPAWVAEGLISEAQRRQLLARYPEEQQALGLLPLLGGLLLGLGILSLVAANWQTLPELVRLAILLATLLAAYGAGELALRRGQRPLGIALLGVGLLSFGAGIVLTGQMYHLVSHSVRALLVWATAGLALTWLYRSRFLYLLTLIILGGAQWYSVEEFQAYSFGGWRCWWAGRACTGFATPTTYWAGPFRWPGWRPRRCCSTITSSRSCGWCRCWACCT